MTIMKARDLPPDARQMVLSQVRNQLGAIEYDILIDKIGEDGIIDLILEKAGSSTGADKKDDGPTSWTVPIVIGLVFVVAAAVGYTRSGWSGAKDYAVGVLNIGVTLLPVLMVYAQLFGWVSQASSVFGGKPSPGVDHAITLVLMAVVVGGIAILAVSVPYVGAGIGTWWSWLVGHFR